MFDIGFWELTIIAVVALLVVGPDRLPALARTVGMYVGRLRRMVNQVREDVEQELRAEEVRRMLEKPDEFEDIGKAVKETEASLRTTSADLSTDVAEPGGKTEAPPTSQAETQPRPPSGGPSGRGQGPAAEDEAPPAHPTSQGPTSQGPTSQAEAVTAGSGERAEHAHTESEDRERRTREAQAPEGAAGSESSGRSGSVAETTTEHGDKASRS